MILSTAKKGGGDSMNLGAKCAVVTGGAMGIGLATTKRLLKEGCKVTIWDIQPQVLEEAAMSLSHSGHPVFAHVCDITDKKRVYELARKAEEEMGRVDILINNAGHVMGGYLQDHPDEVWEKSIAVNLTSMVYTIRAFLPGMYERDSGHIVNISSASGAIGVPGLAVYAATKWAVWGLTESMRFEAWNQNKFGVKWSSIHPSYIVHGMFAGAKLGWLGNLLVPLLKDHDVVAEAIVEDALKKGKYSPKRPRTVNITIRLRGLLPDPWFQRLLVVMGTAQSMSTWKGRKAKDP
jgi:all-trans-retinol dehydrogenase (NAD+)